MLLLRRTVPCTSSTVPGTQYFNIAKAHHWHIAKPIRLQYSNSTLIRVISEQKGTATIYFVSFLDRVLSSPSSQLCTNVHQLAFCWCTAPTKYAPGKLVQLVQNRIENRRKWRQPHQLSPMFVHFWYSIRLSLRESSHHAVTVTAIEKSKATIGKKSLEQWQPTNQLAFEWQHCLGNWKGEVAVFVTAVRVLSEWQQSQQKSGDLQRKQDYIYMGAS